ncbi:MAG: DUF2059 domain-containing protein [Deltaproteobacteria bacterium]|nr:DUF2059 domain-containing protein [Deltaproteobacteria bacterium]
MTFNLKNAVPICIISFLTLFFFASQAGAELSSREMDAYQKFFKVSGAQTQYDQMLGMFLGQFQQGMGAGMKHAMQNAAEMNQSQKDQIIQLSEQSMKRMLETLRAEIGKVMPFEDLLKNIYIPIYSRHFKIEEIEEVTAFFETPVGRKFVSAAPSMMKESMTLINEQYSKQLREAGSRVAQKELSWLKGEIDKIRKP